MTGKLYEYRMLWLVRTDRAAAAEALSARETMLRYSLCPSKYQCIIYESRCIDDAVVLIMYRYVYTKARVGRTRDTDLPAGSSERRLAMNPDIGSR